MPTAEVLEARRASVEASRGTKNGSFTRLHTLNILMMMIFMGSQLTLPYTLSVFMVRDFFSAEGKSEQVIAQLTGLLASTQSLGRALASYPWGMVSDIVGRKVVILIGLLAAMVSILGYGSSTSYTAAILGRFIPSLFVGAPVAIKSALGDACDQEGQAKAMAVFTLGFGIGNVLGPILGGALAYPCKKFSGFPACNEGEFFQKRPFLLPCLAVSCLGGLAFLSMAIVFKETYPAIADAPGGWHGNLVRLLLCRPRQSVEYSGLSSNESADIERPLPLSRRNTDVEMGVQTGRMSFPLDSKESVKESAEESTPDSEASPSSSRSSSNSAAGSKVPPEKILKGRKSEGEGKLEAGKDHQDFREGDEEGRESDLLLQHQESGLNIIDVKQHRWWRDSNVLFALIGAALMALIFNFMDELAPIFVSAPHRDGGIAMTLEAFTYPIGCGGALLIVYSLTLYPRLIKWAGAVTLSRVGLLLAIPGSMLMPVSSLASPYVLQQVCVYLAVMMNNLAKVSGLNSSIIAVNLVADKESMGRINGAAMALQSGGRALGPLLSGLVWAGSVSLHLPGQQFLGFVVIVAALATTQFIYICVKLPQQK